MGLSLSLESLPALIFYASLKTLLVVFIPLFPLAVACRLINVIHKPRLAVTPSIETVSLVFGALIGLLSIYHHIPEGSLTFSGIFSPDSIWNKPIERVLFDLANPLNYEVFSILSRSGSSEIFNYSVYSIIFAILAVPIIINRGPAGIANSTRNLLIFLWGAYAVIYLVCVLFWLLALLNFGIFLVALLVIQFFRR